MVRVVLDCILNLSCPDKLGLVKTVSDWLYAENGNIIDSDQFGDPDSQTFFMRVHFSLEDKPGSTIERLHESFARVGEEHQMVCWHCGVESYSRDHIIWAACCGRSICEITARGSHFCCFSLALISSAAPSLSF